MKIKNAFYFAVACLLLAYDYAWNNYLLPSLVMTLVALLLAYLIAHPSRNETVYIMTQCISIYIVEVIVLLLINQESSTWLNPILAISTIAFNGCWIIVYDRSKKYLKHMFEKFLTYTFMVFMICFIIPMILFQGNQLIQVSVTLFLVYMFMPLIFTIGFHFIKIKLSMTYSIQHKINA
ncbi:hypothetical protein [Anaerorhabdus sp.]|uniref:hypothetical protein n=1 Tax=Anaerorhabdus sp. TaxID=1872524 RepID=UPI002FC5818F